jgi:hypothetical protein
VKRFILVTVALAALILAPGISASVRSTHWCGTLFAQGTGNRNYRLQVHNLTCAKGHSLAVRTYYAGRATRGYSCASPLFCWTRGHVRWFHSYLITASPPPPTPPPPPPAAVGTRSNPFPLGSSAHNSEWSIRVNGVNFDAWPPIAATNMFNDPPPSGYSDVMPNLGLQYLGAGSASVSFDLVVNLSAVGNAGIAYVPFDLQHDCGVLPEPNELDYTTVFSGATFNLNLCFQVPTSDAGSLELHYGNSDVGWFALR